ncbi:MAG: hypothetical protein AB1Z98_29650 [Nannocystaceae bacterium]
MNQHPVAFRSVLLALLLGIGSAMACTDESTLENEDCLSDDDCFSSQTCVRTTYQVEELGGTGWCRPKGDGCVDGDQPGCSCTVLAGSACCTGTVMNAAGATQSLVPHDNPSAGCICVLPDDDRYPIAANLDEFGCIPAS